MQTATDDKLRNTREWLLARGEELRDRLRRVQEDLGRQREPLPKDAPDAAIVIENDEILAAVDKAELLAKIVSHLTDGEKKEGREK